MAVYTEVSDEELASFIASYGLGELLSYKGIAEGVENTNYLVHATRGPFILTLYEKRVARVRSAILSRTDGASRRARRLVPACRCAMSRAKPAPALGRAGGTRHIPRRVSGCAGQRPAHCAAVGRALARAAPRRRRISHCDAPTRSGLTGWRPLFERFAGTRRRDRAGPGAADRAELEISRSQLAARTARGRYPRRPFPG